MPIIQCNSSFMLGIQLFDEHHSRLIELLNEAFDSVNAGDGADVGHITEELVDYASYHFSCEESWMKEHAYPMIEEHCSEHLQFVKRISEMREDTASGRNLSSLELLSFLKNWLINHINNTDATYVRFIKDNGLLLPHG